MYSEALQEILTKIEERAAELRAFCPKCGQMAMMECWTEDLTNDAYWEYYECNSCKAVYNLDFPEELINYNKMRFGVVEHV